MPPDNLTWTLDTKELDRIVKNCDMKAEQVIRHLAFEVEGIAKQLAPYDTTALRNSIYTVTEKDDNYTDASNAAKDKRPGVETEPHPKPGKGEARVGPCVEYGQYQEFGTSKMAAQPYLTPAVEKVRTKFEDGSTYKEICE